MGIMDDMQDEAVKAKPCKAARFIATLSEQDQLELQQVLAAEFSTQQILRVLTRRGAVLSHDALYKHRRGTCCCGNQ